jgi:hypothetical protein
MYLSFYLMFNACDSTRKPLRIHGHKMPPPSGKRHRDEEIRSSVQKREKYTAIAWYVYARIASPLSTLI